MVAMAQGAWRRQEVDSQGARRERPQARHAGWMAEECSRASVCRERFVRYRDPRVNDRLKLEAEDRQAQSAACCEAIEGEERMTR